MIEQYIGKNIDCSCGKTHKSNVEKIVIKNNVIENELVDFLKENGYKKITLVCDKKGFAVAGKRTKDVLDKNGFTVKVHTFTDDYPVPDERSVGRLTMGAMPDSDMFLAVGSGTVNDLTRFVSAVKGLPFATVGIAPSMDGYISAGSALIYNGLKTTFETHAPKAVFFEPTILANAPRDMIGAGVGDLLGKISCLTDWKLSKIITGEWHCDFISGIVEKAIEKTIEAKDGITAQDDNAVATLLEALLLSGVCMDYAGNSRPASGCEHHMSHFLEMRYIFEGRPAVFHGTKVGLCTIISLKAYEYISKLNPDFKAIKGKTRTSYEDWEKAVKKAFMQAQDEIISLEKKAGKNAPENVNARLDVIKEKWNEIKELSSSVAKSDTVKSFLSGIDSPTTPNEIGVEKEMAREMIMYAKEIRNRYTVLQLLYDIDELENFADMIIEEYYGK